jgi:hypothetical protein
MLRLSQVCVMMIGLVGLVACRDDRSNPLASNARNASFDRQLEQDEEGAGFLPLVAVFGPGKGHIRAVRIPHPTTPGNFAVHIEIRIRHAKSHTAYVAQRAPDVFPAGPPAGFDVATLADGSCQRGLSMAPWSTLVPPPVAFPIIPDQAHGLPALIMTTDAEGNASADFIVAFPFPLPLFDVTFRVVESGPAPTSMLQSDCIILPLL